MSALHSQRPWVPARPAPPPLGYLVDGDRFIVPGLAVVLARPHRSPAEARGFARRIAADADAYLTVLADYHVPGVTDCPPSPVLAAGGKGVDHG